MRKLLFLLLLSAACSGVFAQEKTEWMLHNRQFGEYIYDGGSFFESDMLPYDESFIWLIEAGEGAGIRIINKKTGRYLLDKDCDWNLGGFWFDTKTNAGWYTISAEASQSSWNMVLNESGLDYILTDRNKDRSAHWTFVRLDSEEIPYRITSYAVYESSFLGERQAKAADAFGVSSNWRGDRTWKLTKDVSAFPEFTAKGNTLLPALYNMALEESLLDIRPQDSTFMAGALWPDTWTRDVVYSIYFAYSWIMPEVSRRTLEKQTLKNPSEALQDTGSGGSYPVSTDRVVWALAAWEYYLATGDKSWLEQTYEGLRNTALKDLHVAYDPEVGLFRGETCSMDWRTHTYPNWFTNTDIAESFSSGTNALHYFLYRFLLSAGRVTGAPQEEMDLWTRVSSDLREGFNKAFWNEDKGLYSCWLYPKYLSYQPSEKVGVMSNGLAALLGLADEERIADIVENSPLYAHGAAVLYPSKPDGYAYHNKSIWQVWQTPLMYAAKKIGNHKVLDHIVNSAVRSAALFLTHKENMTYDTGYDGNTALNSDRQLWSVASYLSIVYRVLFGMEMTEAGISFRPYVPSYMGEAMSLKSFRYRGAEIDITVKGRGAVVASVKVNGRKVRNDFVLPSDAEGRYQVEIVMKEVEKEGLCNIVPSGPGRCWAPAEPVIRLHNSQVFWTMEPGCCYRLYGQGLLADDIHSPFDISSLPDGYFSIAAVNQDGLESDLSNPVFKSSYVRKYDLDVRDFREDRKDFSVEIDIPEDGDYILCFSGMNGRGPDNTFCAVRSMFLDGKDTATIIFEAYGDWNVETSSNHVIVRNLSAGKHVIDIRYNPEDRGYDNNMSFNKENFNDCVFRSLTVSSVSCSDF